MPREQKLSLLVYSEVLKSVDTPERTIRLEFLEHQPLRPVDVLLVEDSLQAPKFKKLFDRHQANVLLFEFQAVDEKGMVYHVMSPVLREGMTIMNPSLRYSWTKVLLRETLARRNSLVEENNR